jgi:hypothetical protein
VNNSAPVDNLQSVAAMPITRRGHAVAPQA